MFDGYSVGSECSAKNYTCLRQLDVKRLLETHENSANIAVTYIVVILACYIIGMIILFLHFVQQKYGQLSFYDIYLEISNCDCNKIQTNSCSMVMNGSGGGGSSINSNGLIRDSSSCHQQRAGSLEQDQDPNLIHSLPETVCTTPGFDNEQNNSSKQVLISHL